MQEPFLVNTDRNEANADKYWGETNLVMDKRGSQEAINTDKNTETLLKPSQTKENWYNDIRG